MTVVASDRPADEEAKLEGAQLSLLLRWLSYVAETFPDPRVRGEISELFPLLARKTGEGWSRGAYNTQLRQWARAQKRAAASGEPKRESAAAAATVEVGADGALSGGGDGGAAKIKLVTPGWLDGRYNDADDGGAASAWRWCDAAHVGGNPGEGVGGYTCGLWVLFHALLANTPRDGLQPAFELVHDWIVNFFGCADCARHFDSMWETRDDPAMRHGVLADFTEPILWMWRAHNRVRARLAADELRDAPGSAADARKRVLVHKAQWPPLKSCTLCYDPAVRNGSAPIHELEFVPTQWDEQYVFQYLMETFCAGSDGFMCAAYDDPSTRAKKKGSSWWPF